VRTSHVDLTDRDRKPSALPTATLDLLRRRTLARHGWYRVLLERPPSGPARRRIAAGQKRRSASPPDRLLMVVDPAG
jgi:hypothetical protein